MHKILVVDDHQDILEVLAGLLDKKFDLALCSSGKAALTELERGVFDLMLTDIVMPDMEGIELILHCRKNYPGMKIIALTGKLSVGGQDYLEAAIALGANDGVRKPFSLKILLEKINALLAK